jgi:hypothetical protein
MLGATAVCACLRKLTHGDWDFWAMPSTDNTLSVMMARLIPVEKIWKNLMGLTTFLLTFFLAQAFSFWKSVYELGRSIQGRQNDINLLLATHVVRKRDGTYTAEAETLLDDIASKLRAFHVLMWASHANRYRILLTDRGMSRMLARGMLTAEEKEAMDLQLSVPRTQKHIILLEWVLFKCHEARKRGILEGDSSFTRQCNQNDAFHAGIGHWHLFLNAFVGRQGMHGQYLSGRPIQQTFRFDRIGTPQQILTKRES